MYNALFGLAQDPFTIAPDPRFLYMSERHREALAHLLYGLQGGGGLVLLTGAVGAGKTTVVRAFVEQLPETCSLAYIFNPQLSVRELLAAVCQDLGVEAPERGTYKQYVDPLNRFLLANHAAGRSSLLIIDEAQHLHPEVLEQLRLLTNLETDSRKLLQIVLVGQPELRDRLAAPELAQVSQRVIARYHLEPLSEPDTARYVHHRLSVAGLKAGRPFDAAALRRVHRLSGGVPRRINLLCDRALLGAYAQQQTAVTASMVDRSAREVFDDLPPPAPPRIVPIMAGATGVALLLAAAGWWAWLRPAPAPVAVAASSAPASASLAAPAASAASATASAPRAAPPLLDATALAARAGWEGDAASWRALARQWGAGDEALESNGAADPCAALAPRGLGCHSGPSTLALVRQIDRPGWLTLRPAAAGGAPQRVILAGLDERQAWLRLPSGTVRVSLATLASRWTGDYATLWRLPPGEAPTAWLTARLADDQAGALPADTPLPARIEAFQRAQGLPSDGLAGPLTQMQVNRVSGVAEPRLSTEP